MKIQELLENRFGQELDGWYLVDKATEQVVAGPFDSKDDAQKKAMKPPMFANHHRYTVKAFGKALKEALHEGVFTDVKTFLKKIFKKPVVLKDDPQMMVSFENSGGYDKFDVIGWQLGWKCFQMDSSTPAEKLFDKMYYGGGSPFPFDEKSFHAGFKAAKKHYASNVKEDFGKPVEVQIEKGLTREEAMKKAPYKKSYGDCRGFSYDKKTGIATWV